MQRYCTDLTEKLLKSLDKEYNVVDMGAVVDVITALEKTPITKEVLEITRLGKYINELRRKTNNDALAKRAKDLVRRWRDMVLPSGNAAGHITQIETTTTTMPQTLNGTKPQSPAARVITKPRSPVATKNFKPHSPLLRDAMPLKVLSPALSMTSDLSRSPNPAPIKQLPMSLPLNHRLSSLSSPKLSGASQNHGLEAVPRTHSSNKRLRKEDTNQIQPQTQAQVLAQQILSQQCDPFSALRGEPNSKKQRVNGEYVSANINTTNSQVPSPSPTTRERNLTPEVIVVSDDNKLDIGDGPKKRGRKKGSKATKNQLPQDRVKEKLASISRNPKLKTTQELLADLQARGSSIVGTGTEQTTRSTTEPPTTEEILRSSDDLTYGTIGRTRTGSSRSSKLANIGDAIDENQSSTDLNARHDPTVEEILAKLPPLALDTISWSDDEEVDGSPSPRREIEPEDVDRLHTDCVEGLNGNFQFRLTSHEATDGTASIETEDDSEIKKIAGIYRRHVDDDDREFHEWHEMLARPTCDGQILHILPYVIID